MKKIQKMILPNHPLLHILIPHKSPPPVNNYSHTFTEIFEKLNINPTTNKREVTVAFRMLARIYHPNKSYGNIKQFTGEEGEKKFKKLSNAYDDLKNSNTLF